MAILDSLGDGVSSSGGGGFTFSAVEIDTPGDNGWIATNLTGTNTFDNDSLIEDVDTSNRSAIRVQNTDTTLAGLTIENTPFQDGGSGQSVILIESFGASAFDKTPASLASELRASSLTTMTSMARPIREGIFISFRDRMPEVTSPSPTTPSDRAAWLAETAVGLVPIPKESTSSEGIDIEIRNDSGSTYTVDLLIENNSLTTTNNGSREVLFVESKGDATVNVTIRNNSPLSHTGTATGNIIEVEAEDALSTVNASISGKVMDIKYSHFKTRN